MDFVVFVFAFFRFCKFSNFRFYDGFVLEALLILRRDPVFGFECFCCPKRLQVDFMTISGWILKLFSL